jgi:hypothetical protein
MTVHAALTLMEMVSSHDSVMAAVAPQVGKVIQGWLGENDRVNGCKLPESLLLNLRGHIDDVSPAVHTHFLSLLMTCVHKHRNSNISSQLHSDTMTKQRQTCLSW